VKEDIESDDDDSYLAVDITDRLEFEL
jgi:hypothetical protein